LKSTVEKDQLNLFQYASPRVANEMR